MRYNNSYEKEKFDTIEISASKRNWGKSDLEDVKNKFLTIIHQDKNVMDGFSSRKEDQYTITISDGGVVTVRSDDGKEFYSVKLVDLLEDSDFDSKNKENLTESINEMLIFLENKGIFLIDKKSKDAQKQRLALYLRKLKKILPEAEIMKNNATGFSIILPKNFNFNNLKMFQK